MISALSGSLPAGLRVLVATRPVDFRRDADGLVGTVQSILQQNPFTGTVFVFRSKRADRVKRAPDRSTLANMLRAWPGPVWSSCTQIIRPRRVSITPSA
jgi:transposase